jgi:hypothetical protein
MVELYAHSPARSHGFVLNKLSTGTTLPFTLPREEVGNEVNNSSLYGLAF